MASKFRAAMLLLACAIIIGAAGAAALDASYTASKQTYNETHENQTTTDELELGRDVSASTARLVPLFAFIAVPLGIIGILAGNAFRNRGNGGMNR